MAHIILPHMRNILLLKLRTQGFMSIVLQPMSKEWSRDLPLCLCLSTSTILLYE